MVTFLNIALVVLVAATAILALLGEKRENGRLTRIGRATLVLLAFGLIVGVAKEFKSNVDARAAAKRSEQREVQLHQRLANLERALRAERIGVDVLPEESPRGTIQGQIVSNSGDSEYRIDVAAIMEDGRWIGADITNSKGHFDISFDPRRLDEGQTVSLLIDDVRGPDTKRYRVDDVPLKGGTVRVKLP